MTVTLNGQSYTTTVASGAWTITVPDADAQLLNHGNTYAITASEVRRKELPKVDEAFCKAVGVKDAAELRDQLRKGINGTKEQAAETARREKALDALIAGLDLPLPQSAVDSVANGLFNEYLQLRLRNGTLKPDQFEAQREEIITEARKAAETKVRAQVVLVRIAEENGIDLTREEFDYIVEPDVFHDLFGHVPLLFDPVFADHMQAYGAGGLKAHRLGACEQLSRLYWYTIEFGLIRQRDGLRAYGAGILSGPTETVFSVEAQSPNRIMLNVDRVMRTDYVIDDLQPTYFVIENFGELYHDTVDRDFDRLYRALGPGFTYANSAVIDVDDVLHRGTQEYALRGGRGSGARPA